LHGPRAAVRRHLLAAIFITSACAASPDVETDEVTPDDAGKADGYLTELRVRAGDTTLWADRFLVPRASDGREEWVLSARASRTVSDGLSFIFDDVVGEFQVVSARSFAVAYPAGDRGLMTGVSHFVRMHFAPSSSRPTTLTARAIYRPRLVTFNGSGAYLTAELEPVVVSGRVVWRVFGNASSALTAVAASVGDGPVGPPRMVDTTHFTLDLEAEQVTALAAGDELVLDIESASGRWQKRAGLAIGIKTLGLTTGDPVDEFPLPICEDQVRECLASLPEGEGDTSPCGEAIEVLACAGR
jgi:hypothetical protein